MSEVYLVKPRRGLDEMLHLTQENINQNKNKGIETDIFLDLNILVKMSNIIQGKEHYRDNPNYG